MPEKMPFPPVAESQPTSARDGLFPPTSLSVVQNNRPPTETLLNDNHKEGEAIKASPGSTAITEASVADSCIMDPKMETDPAKVDPEERRNTMRYGRGGNDKSWRLFLLFMAAVFIPFCVESARMCFTCLDKEKCPHLKAVYGPGDSPYYQRGVNKSLPICSGMPLLSPKTCNVCLFLSDILIDCSGDMDKPEVEDDNGSQILNISEGLA
ncbi:uncharacterized protein [Brachyistius frenatus]|uniref:uncharacterized protein n=1 Tax=Brachyistius frenatus TaxID=100188 RepID=UPI0037E7FDBB